MRVLLATVIFLAVLHVLLGVMSMCLGVTASIQADVWLAHSVSPIWSGAFFTITGILGFACAKKRTAYMIMCFTAFSIVCLVTAVVSIQLLRLGLVYQTTDGQTYQKEHKDKIIIVALSVTAVECLICVISSFVSCRLARKAKKELERKRDGTFHVQDNDEEGNNNKCAVYSVEKGYHNPYTQNHLEDEADQISQPEAIVEDHIKIMVNGRGGNSSEFTNIFDDADNKILNHSTADANVTSNGSNGNPFNTGVTYHWKNKYNPHSRGNSPLPLKKTGNGTNSESKYVLENHQGDTIDKRIDSDDTKANCDIETNRKSIIITDESDHCKSDNRTGQSVRVEIDEHTDDEECKELTTNMFFVKGTGDKSKTKDDLEVTSP